MLRRWIAGAFAVMLLASALLGRQGTVKTKEGQTFEGDISEDAESVDVTVRGIKTTILRENVAGITYSDSFDEEYSKRMKSLDAKDVAGRIAVAQWAFENRQYKAARDALEQALEIDPNNARATELLNTVRQQMKLHATEPPATRPRTDAGPPDTAPAETDAGGETRPAVGAPTRLLTPDEINEIKQIEWQGERGVKVRLEDDVKRRYLASSDMTPAEFGKLDAAQQAFEIIRHGNKELRKYVRIVNDPPALEQYRRVVQRAVMAGCGTTACHGGADSGNFKLHNPADREAPAYTNYLIVQQYNKTLDGVQYFMVDREHPRHSLLIQYGLPRGSADLPHPDVQGFKPLFRTRNDRAYKDIIDWIGKTLPAIAPDYGIDLTKKPKGSDTKPAEESERGASGRGAAPARSDDETSRPADEGTMRGGEE